MKLFSCVQNLKKIGLLVLRNRVREFQKHAGFEKNALMFQKVKIQ